MTQESATDLERRLAQAQRELSEAREQQAATAKVLRIISSSPGAPRQEQPTPKIKQIAKLTTAVVLTAIAIVLCAYAFILTKQ
jgi:multisubunit Na+/H+ antiporter MnhC subunit